MAKYYVNIGYVILQQTNIDVWKEKQIEREAYGDVLSNFRKLQSGDRVNDDVNIANKISIIADAFANENFHAIRYAEYMGVKWKVSDVEVLHPRLILTLGGIYNA